MAAYKHTWRDKDDVDCTGISFWWYRKGLELTEVFERYAEGVLGCKWCEKEITNPSSFAAHIHSKNHLKAKAAYGLCGAADEFHEQLGVDLTFQLETGQYPKSVLAEQSEMNRQKAFERAAEQPSSSAPQFASGASAVQVSADSYGTLEASFRKMQLEGHNLQTDFRTLTDCYRDLMASMRREREDLRDLLDAGRKRTAEYGRDFEITERTVAEAAKRFNESSADVEAALASLKNGAPVAAADAGADAEAAVPQPYDSTTYDSTWTTQQGQEYADDEGWAYDQTAGDQGDMPPGLSAPREIPYAAASSGYH